MKKKKTSYSNLVVTLNNKIQTISSLKYSFNFLFSKINCCGFFNEYKRILFVLRDLFFNLTTKPSVLLLSSSAKKIQTQNFDIPKSSNKFKKPPPVKTYKKVVTRFSIIYKTVLRRVPCGQTPKIQNIEIRSYFKNSSQKIGFLLLACILIGLPKGGYRLIYPV